MPKSSGGPRRRLARQAYDRIRDWIVEGRLAPGATLIESELAGQLGLSRSHVRAALQRLEHAGFVTTVLIGTYSRARVAPLTMDDVREIFAILGSLEGVAARSAAALDPAERQALSTEMGETNDRFAAALQHGRSDAPRANELDIAFHRALVERAAGPRLLALHRAVKPQAERYERLYMTMMSDPSSAAVEEHAILVEAIAAGEGDAAQRAVETNWRNAAERFCRIIALAGERGLL